MGALAPVLTPRTAGERRCGHGLLRADQLGHRPTGWSAASQMSLRPGRPSCAAAAGFNGPRARHRRDAARVERQDVRLADGNALRARRHRRGRHRARTWSINDYGRRLEASHPRRRLHAAAAGPGPGLRLRRRRHPARRRAAAPPGRRVSRREAGDGRGRGPAARRLRPPPAAADPAARPRRRTRDPFTVLVGTRGRAGHAAGWCPGARPAGRCTG